MKILVIRTSSLGDVVLASAVIEALKESYPSSELFMLLKEEYQGLFEGDPRLSGIITPDPARGIRGLCSLVSDMNDMGLDVIVDLQGNMRSFLIRRLTRADIKLRYKKRRLQRMIMVYAKWIPVSHKSMLEMYLETLRKLGLMKHGWVPRLFVDKGSQELVSSLLSNDGVDSDDTVVGISPGSRWETKRWTSDGFAYVADRLLEHDRIKVAMLGNQNDTDFVNEILSKMDRKPAVCAGKVDMRGLAALIERCSVLLTNDSGPMHIASALGVPVVAIFGPTHPRLGFAPVGEKDITVSLDVPCSPCSLHGEKKCRMERRFCMEDISKERVLEKIESVVSKFSRVEGL